MIRYLRRDSQRTKSKLAVEDLDQLAGFRSSLSTYDKVAIIVYPEDLQDASLVEQIREHAQSDKVLLWLTYSGKSSKNGGQKTLF